MEGEGLYPNQGIGTRRGDSSGLAIEAPGDLIFSTGGAERGRITVDGVFTGGFATAGPPGPAGTGSASVIEAQLNGAVSAGATTITLDRNATAAFGVYRYIVVEPFTPSAELRRVTGATGTVLTLNAGLSNSHGDKALVFALIGAPALIPWSWWGGRPSGATADASLNVTAFNNLSQQIYGLRTVNANGWGIAVDPGLWYINNQLQMERDQVLGGVTSGANRIVAAAGFPFDGTGAVAMIHPQRDGSPVLFHQAGPSGRWFFRNVYLDGNNLANACGVLSSPQQPDHTEGLRVDNCPGLYGVSFNDVQVHDVDGLEVNNCALSLDLWSCKILSIASLAITGPDPSISSGVMVQLTDSTMIHFETADLETMPSGGVLVNASGASSSLKFDNVYSSGFTGGSPNSGDFYHFDCPRANPGSKASYVITNSFCAQNSSSVNFLNDIQRSIALNTFADTDRRLPFAFAHDALYWIALAGGKIKTNAALVP